MKTAEEYEKLTGYKPENDDLERANCEKAGEMGHFYCGWDDETNLPRHMGKPYIKDQVKYAKKIHQDG